MTEIDKKFHPKYIQQMGGIIPTQMHVDTFKLTILPDQEGGFSEVEDPILDLSLFFPLVERMSLVCSWIVTRFTDNSKKVSIVEDNVSRSQALHSHS